MKIHRVDAIACTFFMSSGDLSCTLKLQKWRSACWFLINFNYLHFEWRFSILNPSPPDHSGTPANFLITHSFPYHYLIIKGFKATPLPTFNVMGNPWETDWIIVWDMDNIAHCTWIYEKAFSVKEHTSFDNEAEFHLLPTLLLHSVLALFNPNWCLQWCHCRSYRPKKDGMAFL